MKKTLITLIMATLITVLVVAPALAGSKTGKAKYNGTTFYVTVNYTQYSKYYWKVTSVRAYTLTDIWHPTQLDGSVNISDTLGWKTSNQTVYGRKSSSSNTFYINKLSREGNCIMATWYVHYPLRRSFYATAAINLPLLSR